MVRQRRTTQNGQHAVHVVAACTASDRWSAWSRQTPRHGFTTSTRAMLEDLPRDVVVTQAQSVLAEALA